MLPHVIITRSYCSLARLLLLLSWRGSGQGQTGRAGRAETEYYHGGNLVSCYWALGQLAGCTVTSADTRSSLSDSLRDKFITTSAHLNESRPFRFLPSFSKALLTFNMLYIHKHWPLNPPYSSSTAIERSISHFTASYTFLCHSQLPVHSNSRLAQQRRPRGSCPSLPHTHTHHTLLPCTQTHTYHGRWELQCCSELDGCFVLIRQPALGSWRYLQSTRPAPWKEGFTQLWNIDVRRAPAARRPFDLSFTFLEKRSYQKQETSAEGGGGWSWQVWSGGKVMQDTHANNAHVNCYTGIQSDKTFLYTFLMITST